MKVTQQAEQDLECEDAMWTALYYSGSDSWFVLTGLQLGLHELLRGC